MTKPAETDTRSYSLRSFMSFMMQHKARFALVMSLFAISNTLLAIVPLFIGKLVGALAAHPMQGHLGIIYMVVLIGLSTSHNLTWQLCDASFRRFIAPLCYDYESLLFQQVIRKPYPYFVGKFTGKVSSYINTITQEQRSFLEDLCYNYITQPIGLIAILAIMTDINWQTGAVFAGGVLLMFVVGRYSIRPSTAAERRLADIQSTKNARIIDAIANFVNVKSFRKETAEMRAIDAEEAKTVAANHRARWYAQVFWWSMGTIVRDMIWPAVIGLNVYLFFARRTFYWPAHHHSVYRAAVFDDYLGTGVVCVAV